MYKKSGKSRDYNTHTGKVFQLIFIPLVTVSALFPIVWIVSAAFSGSGGLAGQRLVPEQLTLDNFKVLFTDPVHPFLLWTWNSVKISSITALGAVTITSLSAYAFSRFRFPYRNKLLLGILLVQVFPPILAMVALFLLFNQIGDYIPSLGLNSHGGLILAYLGGQMGINVWLTKGFFDSIPRALDESAMVEGADSWQIFTGIILPLVRPILAVVAVLIFLGTFGEFVIARVLLQQTEQYTLMMGLYIFIADQYGKNWNIFAAGSLLGAIPLVTVYLLLKSQIVEGLTGGAVKG